MLITIPLTLETVHQLTIKPCRRSLVPWCREKMKKKFKNIQKNLKKLQIFLKIAYTKILKNIPLLLEAIQ